jgi:hypothetical protein
MNVEYYGDTAVYELDGEFGSTQYIVYKGYEFSSTDSNDEFTQELESAFSFVVQNKENGENIEYLFYGRGYHGEIVEYRLVKLSDKPNVYSNLYFITKQ